jgi:YHS domain-containing protein
MTMIIGCGEKKDNTADMKDGTAVNIEQKTCPVMEGNPINKEIYTDYNGRRIYFCCPACKETFAKDPDKYIAKVDAEIAELKGKAGKSK